MPRKTIDMRGDRRRRKGKRTTKTSTTSPREIAYREKVSRALEYRKLGYTYEQIGSELKVDPAYAYRLVKWGLDNMIAEPAEDLRKVMRARIEEMMVGLLDKAFAGEIDAQDAVRKNMELQAKLDGLFAPTSTKVEHSGEVQGGQPIFVLSAADAKL